MEKNDEKAQQQGESVSKFFPLRVIPWFTDGCSTFLNNLFKWLPVTLSKPLRALEFGGGNSTFYLLAKRVKVVTVESDKDYIQFICNVARNVGFKVAIVSPAEYSAALSDAHELVIIQAKHFSEAKGLLLDYRWEIVINDGIARKEVLETISEQSIDAIVVLDNVEYCANWGRLDRSSAKPDLIKVYRAVLRSKEWSHYIFEQPEGREGHGAPDKTGWEAPHRWVSAVLWPKAHLLNELMVSHIGLPVVNLIGAGDSDMLSLTDRCPFDWGKMVWTKDRFPPELDLKLERRFE